MKLSKKVYLSKDEKYGLFLCGDHFNGIVVQIEYYNQKPMGQSEGGETVYMRNVQGIFNCNISLEPEGTFKARVQEGIAKGRSHLSQLQKSDKLIDGILNDYLSQNKELNK